MSFLTNKSKPEVHADEHKHNYRFNTSKKDFELITDGLHEGLYRMIEYGFLSCYCTAVKKVVVETGDDGAAHDS